MSPKTVKVNQTLAAIHNRRLTLKLLSRYGALSRKQLADMTGMHGSTLSNIMSEFLEQNLVREIGKRESTSVGKKQTLVEINPDYGWVLGVGIHENAVDLIAMNVRGEPIASFAGNVSADLSDLTVIIKSALEHCTETPGFHLEVDLGVPGIIDNARGMVVCSDFLGISNEPVARPLSEALGVPVNVENDVQVSTLAESYVRQATSQMSFIYFHTNYVEEEGDCTLSGFGIGLFLNGQLYQGKRYGAGELVEPLRPKPFANLSKEDLELLADPEGDVNSKVLELPEWFAPVLCPAVTLLDPEEVVLGGNLDLQNKRVIKLIEDEVRGTRLSTVSPKIKVSASLLPSHRVAYGAALTGVHRALENLYESSAQ